MNQKTSSLLLAIAVFCGVVVVLYGTISYLALKRTEIANQARFECSQISRYETKDKDGAIVSYPVKDLYDKCLKEKGM